MAEDQRKAELIAELDRARRRIAAEYGGLRRAFDFPQRAKDAVMKNPVSWVGGATLFGVLLSKLLGRRRKALPAPDGAVVTAGKTGLILGALKIAFDLSRPALVKWATQHVADYMHTRRNGGRSPR